jgi:hypothetical protein
VSQIAVCSSDIVVSGSPGSYTYSCSEPFTTITALSLSFDDVALLSGAVALSFSLAFIFRIISNMLGRR